MDLKAGMTKVGEKVSQNSPSILLGVGIGLGVLALVLVADERPKADRAMQEKRCELADADVPSPYVEKAQIILAGAKEYAPAIAVEAGSIFCICYAQKLNLDKQAALASAYVIADKTLATYKEEMAKKLGPQKAEDIREAVAQKQLDENPVGSKRDIYVFGEDEHLCMDSVSGRYFKASISKIREAEYQVNKEMVSGIGEVVVLNTLYEALDLESTKAGEVMGWDILHGDRLEIHLHEGTATDGRPCWVLDYDVRALVARDW